MDRDSLISSVDLVCPVYMEEKRIAISKQAGIGIDAAKESARRTDLQVAFDVKRMYYGAVLAKNLSKPGRETPDRFEVSLDLTESLTFVPIKTNWWRPKISLKRSFSSPLSMPGT